MNVRCLALDDHGFYERLRAIMFDHTKLLLTRIEVIRGKS